MIKRKDYKALSLKDKEEVRKNRLQITAYENEISGNDVRLIILGDSMFLPNWGSHPFFANYLQLFSHSWGGELTRELIDFAKPNFIIIERTERFIGQIENVIKNCDKLFCNIH